MEINSPAENVFVSKLTDFDFYIGGYSACRPDQGDSGYCCKWETSGLDIDDRYVVYHSVLLVISQHL